LTETSYPVSFARHTSPANWLRLFASEIAIRNLPSHFGNRLADYLAALHPERAATGSLFGERLKAMELLASLDAEICHAQRCHGDYTSKIYRVNYPGR
jgi:hypothetical protein